MLITFWNRARNNKGRSGFIHQHGVNLIHHGVMMLPLHQLFRVTGHVVPQVIKAKFVVGAVGDVGQVSISSFL